MKKATLRQTVRAAATADPTLVLKNANVVNVFSGEIIRGDVALFRDRIIGVGTYSAPREIDIAGGYLCPGFVDAHMHIESSMVTPDVFSSVVLPHGTTAIIADPHEIANVSGAAGIRYMLDATESIPLHVFFMMPSCVPASVYEHNGCTLLASDLAPFFSHKRVLGLAEVMNYPALIRCEPAMIDKMRLSFNKPIDGHAPQLSGDALKAYCAAGPGTDHESSSFEEILEKIRAGMKILIRVGSAANNMMDVLSKIARSDLPVENFLFCTDDKHIADIQAEGHINAIARMAVRAGIDPVSAVRMATINPCRTYGIRRRGAIAPGYIADMVVFRDLADFEVLSVYVGGKELSDLPRPKSVPCPSGLKKTVRLARLPKDPFAILAKDKMPVIEMPPGQILTRLTFEHLPQKDGFFVPENGYVKLAVLERHHATGAIGLGVLKNFGITGGAIASTVAHDSHNLIVAGDSDSDMLLAVRTIEESGGGYAVVSGGRVLAQIPLPIAGLMTDAPVEQTLAAQEALLKAAFYLGVPEESDPFIRLSFLALPVIPEVRLTDMGVFDSTKFRFIR